MNYFLLLIQVRSVNFGFQMRYMDREWTARWQLHKKPDELSVITFEAHEGSNKITMVGNNHTSRYPLGQYLMWSLSTGSELLYWSFQLSSPVIELSVNFIQSTVFTHIIMVSSKAYR